MEEGSSFYEIINTPSCGKDGVENERCSGTIKTDLQLSEMNLTGQNVNIVILFAEWIS
jgi:hypothetical protein